MNDWESYWHNIKQTGVGGEVFWDTATDSDAQEELQRFIHYMDTSLPLIDIGCGNGRWSRFFSHYFPQVIGVDISPSAVRLAQQETVHEKNVQYRVYDGTDNDNARALHDEFGDMNIYMRGVLHMIKWHDRPAFIHSLEILLGEGGTLYQIELPAESILYLRSLPQDLFQTIPKVTRRVGFNLEERQRFYPDDRWTVLAEGRDAIIHTIDVGDGRQEAMPAGYLVLRRKITPGSGSDSGRENGHDESGRS